jgi:hypothetical protein
MPTAAAPFEPFEAHQTTQLLAAELMAAHADVTPRTQSQVQAMATHWSEWAAAHEELLIELDSSWDATVLPAPFLWGTGAAAG